MLSISTDHGEATLESDIYHVSSINMRNWLLTVNKDEKAVSNFIDCLKNSEIENVAILKSIFVPKEDRNQGFGNQLMEDYFNLIDDASIIILEVDTEEDNAFSLFDWYEGYDFEKITMKGFENLMMLSFI